MSDKYTKHIAGVCAALFVALVFWVCGMDIERGPMQGLCLGASVFAYIWTLIYPGWDE